MTIETQREPVAGVGSAEDRFGRKLLPAEVGTFSTIFRAMRSEPSESPGVQGWIFNPDTRNYEPVEDTVDGSR